MEFFMVKTGFYDKVTQLEADKIADQDAKREAFFELIKTPGTLKKDSSKEDTYLQKKTYLRTTTTKDMDDLSKLLRQMGAEV